MSRIPAIDPAKTTGAVGDGEILETVANVALNYLANAVNRLAQTDMNATIRAQICRAPATSTVQRSRARPISPRSPCV